jgi:hypothetical protein
MKQRNACLQQYWLAGMLLIVVFLLSGCGKPGNSANNYTNCLISLMSLNENEPLQSDVVTNGYGVDDVVSVTVRSDFRVSEDDPTAPAGPSVFDTVLFHSYHVTHLRSDGGPNPADFTAGLSARLEPDSETEIKLVIVRAFDKHRTPLEELRDDGEIFTTTTITLYGQDGYGNDIALSGSIAVSFANFPDE